jgi:hypothetical protein
MVRIWSLSSGALLQEMGPLRLPVTSLEWVSQNVPHDSGELRSFGLALPESAVWGMWMGGAGFTSGPMLATSITHTN